MYCMNCAAWERRVVPGGTGTCHRHPPVPVPNPHGGEWTGVHPVTGAYNWCLDFVAETTPPDTQTTPIREEVITYEDMPKHTRLD